MQVIRRMWLVPVVAALAACTDVTSPSTARGPQDVAPTRASADIPPREGRWVTISSQELWGYIAEHDSTITLGVKAPGSVRGMYRAQRLVPDAVWRQAVRSVADAHGGRLLQVDSVIPAMRIHVGSLEALDRLRRLPFVDYVEPAVLKGPTAQATAKGTRSPTAPRLSGSSGGTPNYGAYNLNGDSVPLIFQGMQIDRAWVRSTGAGVVVGLIDTGIDPLQNQLTHFLAKTARPEDILRDRHGHGTHQAGVLAARRDGQHVVGVAYGATPISIKHGNDYLDVLTWQLAASLDTAVAYNAKVITMAFRAEDQSNSVSDRISLFYWSPSYDVLFTAAVGSGGWAGQVLDGSIFPASHPDVIAVSAIDYYTDERFSGSHHSPKVELSAYHGQPTTGAPLVDYNDWSTSGNSSNAATIVAGVAALVRARFPHMSNGQVRQLLASTAKDIGPAGRDRDSGFGVVNAMRALGGFWGGAISRHLISGGEFGGTGTYQVSAHIYGGDGPFTFLWNDGSTSSSRTITVEAGSSYHVSVQVQDLSDGTTRTFSTTIDGPPGGCENPGEIICS